MSEIDGPGIAPTPAAPLPHTRRGRPILVTLAIIAVLGTVLYLLRVPARHQLERLRAVTIAAAPPAPVAVDSGRIAALDGQIDQLQQRVATLEQRVAALSTAPAKPTPAPPPTPAAPSTSAPGTDPVVLALSARMDRLDAQIIDQGEQLKADQARLQAAGNQADAVTALTDRTARLARVQAAAAALNAGLPLGDLPGAPPALARFRTDPPPTEAQLRLAFPATARAARAAARPDTARLGFWRAMRQRAASLVTVRRGDQVLVGSTQIGQIDRAQAALDAGDLAGAVTILGGLDGPAAAAAADWRARAQSLLDARLALARLAGQS